MTLFPRDGNHWPESWTARVAENASGGKARPARKRYKMAQTSLLARGEPLIWLTGGGLALAIIMIVGLIGLVAWEGTQTFWPSPLVEIELKDGTNLLGEVTARAASPSQDASLSSGTGDRQLLRTGNFEITGTHYRWIDDADIAREAFPPWAVVVERLTWGRFYGFPRSFLVDGEIVASEPAEIWSLYEKNHPLVLARSATVRGLQSGEIGTLNRMVEQARLDIRKAELATGSDDSPAVQAARTRYDEIEANAEQEFDRIREQIDELNRENDRQQIVLATASGQEKTIPLAEIVRVVTPNRLTTSEKWSVYLGRWWEFLSDEPRSANSEGGVFPAIWGTVAMTMIMTIAVVPFGVLAALYLREYAKAGILVSIVRIAVNNLAGVPSIVFGVFGLGFFCYIIGGSIDSLFFEASLPNPTFGKGGILWASLTLALLTLPVVIVATEEALAAVPGSMREGSYACGASKWQTIRRIVLPRAMPGIMTGMMLAVARGAGEVAPLMLVGAVKLAPALPVDGVFPYIHFERSFMHLGFQIYDSGFQSQNSEAAKPLVFTITLLLVFIVASMGVAGIWVRQKFHRRYLASKF